MRLGIILALMMATTANAQTIAYSPPDRELWDLMNKALDDIPMSLNAHQQVQGIIANVQREAQMREARAKATAPKPEAQKEDGK